MSTKKEARTLGIRLDETEATILSEIEAATTIAPVALARAAISAVIRRWKANKELAIPFHLVTIRELEKPLASPVSSEATPASIVRFPSQPQQLNRVAEDATGTAGLPQAQQVSYTSGRPRKTKS